MEDYIERMKKERQELDSKLGKLVEFNNINFPKLSDTERYLFNKQASAMRDYLYVLDARIAYAILKENRK